MRCLHPPGTLKLPCVGLCAPQYVRVRVFLLRGACCKHLQMLFKPHYTGGGWDDIPAPVSQQNVTTFYTTVSSWGPVLV